MTGNEKFQLEFLSTEELALLCRECAEKERKLKEQMNFHGSSHPEYAKWSSQRWENRDRFKYLKSRLQSRQLKLF